MKAKTLADILREKKMPTSDFTEKLKKAKISATGTVHKRYLRWKEVFDTLDYFSPPSLQQGESASVEMYILPTPCSYSFSDRNTIKVSDLGGIALYCGVNYKVHMNMGPDNAMLVCLESFSDPDIRCPICQLSARFRKKGDEKTANALVPRLRAITQLILPTDETPHVRVFDFSAYSFYGKIVDAFHNTSFDDSPTLTNGVLPVRVTFTAGENYIAVESVDDVEFLDVTPEYPDSVLLSVKDIASILRILPPKLMVAYVKGDKSLEEVLEEVRALEEKGVEAVLEVIYAQCGKMKEHSSVHSESSETEEKIATALSDESIFDSGADVEELPVDTEENDESENATSVSDELSAVLDDLGSDDEETEVKPFEDKDKLKEAASVLRRAKRQRPADLIDAVTDDLQDTTAGEDDKIVNINDVLDTESLTADSDSLSELDDLLDEIDKEAKDSDVDIDGLDEIDDILGDLDND